MVELRASSGSRFNLEFCFSMHRRLLLVVWEREKGIFRAIAIKTTICSADEPLSCRTSSCHRVGGFNLFRQEFSRQDKRGSNSAKPAFLMKRLNHEIVRLNISSLGSAIAINHRPPFVSPGFLLRGQRFNKTDQATSLDPHQMTDIQIFYF